MARGVDGFSRRWGIAIEFTQHARLAEAPHILPLAPESQFVDYESRHVLFKTRKGQGYRALFTIVGNEIRVLHVRGPGQDVMSEDQLGNPAER